MLFKFRNFWHTIWRQGKCIPQGVFLILWAALDNSVKRCDNPMIDSTPSFTVVNRVGLSYRIYSGLGGEGFLTDSCPLKECIDSWETTSPSPSGRWWNVMLKTRESEHLLSKQRHTDEFKYTTIMQIRFKKPTVTLVVIDTKIIKITQKLTSLPFYYMENMSLTIWSK